MIFEDLKYTKIDNENSLKLISIGKSSKRKKKHIRTKRR